MPTATIDPITQQLRALIESSPDLKDAARLYEIVLAILRDADLRAAPIALTAEQARAKMEMGLPLLHDVDLSLDDSAVRDVMMQLARAVEATGAATRKKLGLPWSRDKTTDAAALYESARGGDDATLRVAAARQIRRALEEQILDVAALLPHVAAGDSGFFTSIAQSEQLDPGLLWTIAQNAFKPALRAWCRQLSPIAHTVEWNKGYCFVCGAGATLGELQENDQVKHLRCGQCGADWQSRRLQCMYCGNQDHNTLGFLYPENQREKMRVQVCDRCHGYLKMIAAFSPTPPEQLAVQDLATLHLDYIAQEHGYARVAIQ